jgi:hypothetical protein
MSDIVILKSNGKEEVFNEKKLIRSLQKSGAMEEDVTQTVSYVKSKLKKNMSTGDIYALAYKNLKSNKEKNPNAIRYSLKKSVMELGPTGFPFEKFVARIFKEMGYEAKTGVIVQGNCIEHEVDVFAYNDTDVICIEAKFHNEPHLRSDTKVALYVKARFDDLVGQKIQIGETYRHITRGILITNTNFTDTAYQYVACTKKYDLISWNKPNKENLLYYIETYHLYPIGVIPELSQKEIDLLVERDILTCLDLKNNFHMLDEIGIRKSKQDTILEVVTEICNC